MSLWLAPVDPMPLAHLSDASSDLLDPKLLCALKSRTLEDGLCHLAAIPTWIAETASGRRKGGGGGKKEMATNGYRFPDEDPSSDQTLS